VSAVEEAALARAVIRVRRKIEGLPPTEAKRVALEELEQLPEAIRDAAIDLFLSGVSVAETSSERTARRDRYVVGGIALAYISIMLVVHLNVASPTSSQDRFFRLLESVAGGGLGAFLPGTVSLHIRRPMWQIRAAGALALALVFYLIGPLGALL
jgi:hypothetical protein